MCDSATDSSTTEEEIIYLWLLVDGCIKDAAVGDPYLKVLHEFLENLYKLYHYSPVCWHGLEKALCMKVVKPVNVLGTR